MKQEELTALLIEQMILLNDNLSRITGVHVEDVYKESTRAQNILDMIKSKQAPQESKLRQMLNNLKRK